MSNPGNVIPGRSNPPTVMLLGVDMAGIDIEGRVMGGRLNAGIDIPASSRGGRVRSGVVIAKCRLPCPTPR